MKAQDLGEKPMRSGVIPYYVENGKTWVRVMKPSDPKYGGTEWQMAKGGIEDGLSPEANALKEGHEEVGLKQSNIIKLYKLLYKSRLYVYAAEISDPNDFDPAHWETGAVAWLALPDQLQEIRGWQRWMFQALHQRISTNTERDA